MCCGLISLKTALIAIASLDIIMGIVWLSIGLQLYIKSKLNSTYAVYIAINLICLILASISLFAIGYKKTNYLRYYFMWKCFEIVIIPLISLLMIYSAKDKELTDDNKS